MASPREALLRGGAKAIGVPAAAGILGGPVGLATAGGVAAGYETFKGIITIREGEVGVRFRLGKVSRYRRDNPQKGRVAGDAKQLQPGVHISFPGTHPIRRVSIQDRPQELDEIDVRCRDDKIYMVKASIWWGISTENDGPAKSLVKVDGIEHSIGLACLAGIRSAATQLDTKLIDTDGLSQAMFDLVGQTECPTDLAEHGAELRRLRIIKFSPWIGQMIKEAGNAQTEALIAAGILPGVEV